MGIIKNKNKNTCLIQNYDKVFTLYIWPNKGNGKKKSYKRKLLIKHLVHNNLYSSLENIYNMMRTQYFPLTYAII